MDTKLKLLLLVVVLVLVLVLISSSLIYNWPLPTNKNSDFNPSEDVEVETERVDKTYDEFANVEYITQLKGMLSDERAQYLEEYIEKINQKNGMTALEQRKVEARLVPIEMKKQIIDRYNQEVPAPTESIYLPMSEEDFYITVVDYYASNLNDLLDGGSEVHNAISEFLEGGNINLVGLANIQELYRKNQQATVKSVGIEATNNDVFEVLLTYYQEVEQVSESEDTLELKRMIEKAANDEVISVADFNKIKKLYESIIKKDALTTLQGLINNKT